MPGLTKWVEFTLMATFGITWHKMGLDVDLIPVGILTGNFRIDIDS